MRVPAQRRQCQAAFTLVEIALCIGIIGFALVAIIGILPAGLQVQRDNREDTIISQEGRYLMDAIRNGAEGLDELSERVRLIVITNVTTGTEEGRYINTDRQLAPREVVGLLSTPSETGGGNEMREVRAILRAGVGAAADAATDLAFEYQVTIRNLAYTNVASSEAFQQVVGAFLRDVRLDVRWPVFRDDTYGVTRPITVGSGRQIFRQQLSGVLTPEDPAQPNNPRFWFVRQ